MVNIMMIMVSSYYGDLGYGYGDLLLLVWQQCLVKGPERLEEVELHLGTDEQVVEGRGRKPDPRAVGALKAARLGEEQGGHQVVGWSALLLRRPTSHESRNCKGHELIAQALLPLARF